MYKVMIVDDVEVMRRELKRLELWGDMTGFLITQEAGNGYEAINILKDNDIDLIITDIRMPKLDGLEMLAGIMELATPPLVVIASEFNEFSYAKRGLVLGAIDYIVKPVQEVELFEVLQRVKQRLESGETKSKAVIPASEIEELIKLIENGDEQAVAKASHITNTVYKLPGITDHNIEIALGAAENKIRIDLFKSFSWLEKIFDLDADCELITLTTSFTVLFREFYFGNRYGSLVKMVHEYCLNNMDAELIQSAIADALYISRSHMSETFKQKTGITLKEYIIRLKIARAKKLLSEGKWKSYEIAHRIGYNDAEYFSKVFKKHTGHSPTEYKKMTG